MTLPLKSDAPKLRLPPMLVVPQYLVGVLGKGLGDRFPLAVSMSQFPLLGLGLSENKLKRMKRKSILLR